MMNIIKSDQSCYRFRLIFCFPSSGVITPRENEEDQPIEMHCDCSNGQKATLASLGMKPLSETNEFEFSVGGFETPDDAWAQAKNMESALLMLCADQGLGVDVGKVEVDGYSDEKAAEGTARFSEGLFGDLPTIERKQVISYKRGITVVKQPSADYGYKTVGVRGRLALQPFSIHGFWAAWVKLLEQNIHFDNKILLALELFNAAFFEHSMRARFLTWILMLESISQPVSRSPEIIDLVHKIEAIVKHERMNWPNNSDERSFQGIMSTLSYMKSESITQSLQKLVESNAGELTFGSLKPSKFIQKCYGVRSSLVHDGSTGITEAEFFHLVYELQNLATHVLRKLLGLSRLEVPEEWYGATLTDIEVIL